MASLGILSPWVIYYKEIDIMFKDDPTISVIYDNDEQEIRIYVNDRQKADALENYLPAAKDFGDMVLKITVIPSNDAPLVPFAGDTVKALFKDNPIVSYITTHPILGMQFVVFKYGVAQYFADNLGDVNGMNSTLFQDIAKRVFVNMKNVYFCTDLPDENGKSLGKQIGLWP